MAYECPKCGGTGVIREYSHVAGGCCFHCNGKGTVDRLPRERKPRRQLTWEEKQAKVARQNAAIIAEALSFAIKRAGWLGDEGTSVLAQYSAQRAAVHDVATAREYEASVSRACSRIEAINFVMRNADCPDCAHWLTKD